MSRILSPQAELPYPATWFERFLFRYKRKLMLASFVAAFACGIFDTTDTGIKEAEENSQVQTARTIELCMFQYSVDHNGKYPKGESSTEVFQQLIDQKYTTDPSLFYFSMYGKSKPDGLKLKPENVCWDVTSGIQDDDSDGLPVVFVTGYKIDYVPNGKALPLIVHDPLGIAVAYKGNWARFIHAATDGILFIPFTFDPKGRTYRQLTPDGPIQ